jgi:hypothetical protein
MTSVIVYLCILFGSVLGPKHGLGKDTLENVILQDNLGIRLWMNDL